MAILSCARYGFVGVLTVAGTGASAGGADGDGAVIPAKAPTVPPQKACEALESSSQVTDILRRLVMFAGCWDVAEPAGAMAAPETLGVFVESCAGAVLSAAKSA